MTARVSRLRQQGFLLVWLVLVWNLLWGTFSWANLLSGVVIALVITTLLPLPTVETVAAFRPVAAVRFVGRFLADLVVSSVEVSWLAFRPGTHRSAIITVQLRTDSDLLLTVIAEALSLVPGSLVLDLDREHSTMAVHLVQVRDAAHVERLRADVLGMEDRVVRAFGSAEDIARLDAPGTVTPEIDGTERMSQR
ncbi:multicomponent Na+:H+ antiporter subunit E [Klenkia marina]|uniref:Multicomponent Na+:H+ antiporter subunit E n=1 Tax=Klenkia marina TaxID=1960309 RepID=A0A1G4XF89_9ACTN|nr:Na+/H+ antiporter subunit E [Klenkia marina]SCX39805.1 multicomponent Na+:H+ antiporter subunit E [Klenkia marina]